jgi:hypothetical protein
MINTIGKTLVLIHVTLSLLALTWAGAILLQFVDWGWQKPRLDVSERVASELDKRIAAVEEAKKARDRVLPALKRSQDALFAAQDRYAVNHLFYRDELNRLEKNPNALVVKEVKFTEGVAVPEPARIGTPVLDQVVPGIDKSLVKYLEDLRKIRKDIDALVADHRNWTDQSKLITLQLNGMDEKGNKVKVGLYDLLENEAQTQARIRFEKDYIQPQWADSLEQAQQFSDRRAQLEENLKRLEKDLGVKGKK